MTEEQIPLVPFGKYKGRPVTDLLLDSSYLSWIRLQPGMKDKYPAIYNVIITGSMQKVDNPTPEHNRLQNKFLDPIFCQVFNMLIMGKILQTSSSIEFEKDNWDVVNRFFDDMIWETYGEHIVCIEIKPRVGDDYPSILRTLQNRIRMTKFPGDRVEFVLLIDKFESSVTTKSQLISIFDKSKIKVLFFDDIPEYFCLPDVGLHRVDGPSIKLANGSEAWFNSGKLHRIDGPAVKRSDGTEVWYENDTKTKKKHPDGTEELFEYGDLKHRKHPDGTEELFEYDSGGKRLKTKKSPDGTEEHYVMDCEKWVLHNSNGPAIKRPDGTEEWFNYGTPKGPVEPPSKRSKVNDD